MNAAALSRALIITAVALIGCGTFVVFCSRHPADLVASDYYEQEVRFQGQIDRIQRTQKQAALTSVSYEAARRRIIIALAPAPAEKVTGQVQLYRPSAASLDKALKLEPDASGVQTIEADSLSAGLWKVRVSWRSGGQDYYVEQSVVIGAKAS